MKRLILPLAALLASACADDASVNHPGPLMASAPAVAPAVAPAPAVMAPASTVMAPAVMASAAKAPAEMAPTPTAPLAAAAFTPVPSPADLAPPPSPPITFPPIARATDGSTGGSRLSAPTDGLACPPGKTTVSTEAAWSGGGDWQGTGHPDPEPLKKITDADMLALAADLGRGDPDRQHALVSIGRRKLRGAIDVYRQSLAPSQPRAIREMSITGLIEHGGPAALPLFKQALTTEADAQLRGMAIWAIAFYGPSEAHAAILLGLEDPAPEVQGMAVLAVWALRDRLELALPILEATALADERRVWQESLNVLDRLPASDAGNLLARFAETSKGDKQVEAVRHLRTWRRRYPELCR